MTGVQTCALPICENDFFFRTFDARLKPGFLRRIGDVHEFEADGAAVGAAQNRDHFEDGGVLQAEHAIDEDLAIVICVGEAIGRAGTIAEAARNAKTVEGVASAPAILELAHRVGVGVPIIEAVADVVSGKLNAIQAIDRLMSVALEEEL